MKRFLSAGEGYGRSRGSGSPAQPQKDKVFCVSLFAPKVTGMWLLVAFFWLCWVDRAEAQGGGRATTDAIRPLQIGDTIPDALWDLPLQVVNHPEGREMITLRDYRGKLIILDFWATWCTACIHGFQRLDFLGHYFGPQIQFVLVNAKGSDKKASIVELISREKPKHPHGLPVPTAIEESFLPLYFPHKYLPHYVWIDEDGKFIKTTPTKDIDLFSLKNYFRIREKSHKMVQQINGSR